jgi:hypothetical protein
VAVSSRPVASRQCATDRAATAAVTTTPTTASRRLGPGPVDCLEPQAGRGGARIIINRFQSRRAPTACYLLCWQLGAGSTRSCWYGGAGGRSAQPPARSAAPYPAPPALCLHPPGAERPPRHGPYVGRLCLGGRYTARGCPLGPVLFCMWFKPHLDWLLGALRKKGCTGAEVVGAASWMMQPP